MPTIAHAQSDSAVAPRPDALKSVMFQGSVTSSPSIFSNVCRLLSASCGVIVRAWGTASRCLAS
jgi:hypothetical protein